MKYGKIRGKGEERRKGRNGMERRKRGEEKGIR